MGLSVVPFSAEHIDDAGRLLAARHARHRLTEPLLSERYETPSAAHEQIAEAWSMKGAYGAAAVRKDRLVGYLIGAPRDDAVWGEDSWIEAAGHAVEEAEIVRDLYAAAAAEWVERGRRRHYAVVPAHDVEVVDAWFRLGFGHQQALGIREVSVSTGAALPDGVEIREPRENDIEALLDVDLALPIHQRLSPVFSERPLPSVDELRREWRSTLTGDVETVLIGLLVGRPVACWSFRDIVHSDHHRGLARPERACYLSFAATLPEARGHGVGSALTDASLAAAAGAGYAAMVTDWRVTNLLSSRFWPRRGFRTSFVRLYRSIS